MSKRQAVFPTRMTLTTFKQRQVGAQKGKLRFWGLQLCLKRYGKLLRYALLCTILSPLIIYRL
jgi:hypothetical protein